MSGSQFRITTAKDADGRKARPYMIDQEPRPFTKPLTCWWCTRPVRAVSTYTKANESLVRAHFALIKGEHDPDCKLNPKRVVEQIARGSHGLASAGDDGTLRLVFPDQEAPPPDAAHSDDEDAAAAGRERAQLRITTTTPWLPPALNSAVKVARFLRQCDFDDAAARRFTVVHHGKPMRWSRFCYGPEADSLAQLHSRVHKAGRPGLPHPVAVHGTVQEHGQSSTGKPFVVLATGITPQTGGARQVQVVLRSDFPTLLGPLAPGRQVLAVGDRWKLFSRKGVEEVQLWVEDHWRIAHWSFDETTGQAGQPACPSAVPTSERPAPEPPRGKPRKRATAEQRRAAARRTPSPPPSRRKTARRRRHRF